MSETTTAEANPEAKKLSYAEYLKQGGEVGKNRREKAEAESAVPEEPAEEKIELGLDGEPLPSGEQLDLYNKIIETKINDPDARVRDRAGEWGLNYGQRYKMGDEDLRQLEQEAERELGRIEAKQKSDEFKAQSAEHEAQYQREMSEFRSDKELYDMFYEAALKQLPEPELTANDTLGRHYEQQQLEAAREKEAARIADVVLTQFKNVRNPDKSQAEPEASSEPEPKATQENTPDATSSEDNGNQVPEGYYLPPLDLDEQPYYGGRLDQDDDASKPPLVRPTPPTPTVPLPPIAPAPAPPEVPHHVGEPTAEELRDGVEVNDSDEVIRDTVGALEALLRADYPDGNYPDEYRTVLDRAHNIVDKSRWEKIKGVFSGEYRWSDVFTKTSAATSERGVTPEGRKRKLRTYVVGAGALIATGLAGFGFMQGGGEEVPHFPSSSSSVETPDRLPPVDFDSGAQTVEFSSDARTAEQSEGWYQTIREATGIKNQDQLQTLLREVGPKLIHMGEAYPFDQKLGSYGIAKPGRISDEALHLIYDAAKRRGFL